MTNVNKIVALLLVSPTVVSNEGKVDARKQEEERADGGEADTRPQNVVSKFMQKYDVAEIL